jgi:hypothetical protein
MAAVLNRTNSQPEEVTSPFPYPDLDVQSSASIETYRILAFYFLAITVAGYECYICSYTSTLIHAQINEYHSHKHVLTWQTKLLGLFKEQSFVVAGEKFKIFSFLITYSTQKKSAVFDCFNSCLVQETLVKSSFFIRFFIFPQFYFSILRSINILSAAKF